MPLTLRGLHFLTEAFFFCFIVCLCDFAMSQSPPEIKMNKSPDYRIVSATGVFGGVNPSGGRVIFFIDRFEPVSDRSGKLSLESINRELQVEVHLSPATFKTIAEWMTKHIKEFEEREKQQITPAKMDERPKQWV